MQGVILHLDKAKIEIKRITTGRQNLGFSEVNKTKVMAIKADRTFPDHQIQHIISK